MRRSLLLFPLAVVFLLAAPAVAGAGGFATAGLSSTPEGVAPGQPWKVDITVLQHGRTPLEGLTPRVRISSGDKTREFAAKPTGKPGVYRAEVVFPRAGRWDYEVLDGFNDAMPHTFPAVRDRRRRRVPGGAVARVLRRACAPGARRRRHRHRLAVGRRGGARARAGAARRRPAAPAPATARGGVEPA